MITEDRQSSLVALEGVESFRWSHATVLPSHCVYLRAAAKVRKAAERDETREIGGAKCINGQFFLASTVLAEALLEMLGFLKKWPYQKWYTIERIILEINRNIDLIHVCYGKVKASHRPTSMCSFNRHFQQLWLLQKPGSCLNTWPMAGASWHCAQCPCGATGG